MTTEQRTLFRETQAVMSLLEGFSDYVMDEVGKDLVPGVERISAKFHERRHARRSPFERAVMRLTGMDVKLEQYAKGEAFVSAIATRRRAGRPEPALGRARRRCRATARSTIPPPGSPGSGSGPPAGRRGSRDRRRVPQDRGAGLRAGRRADRDRPVADPVGPLSRRATSS